jgi:hypothetical protein
MIIAEKNGVILIGKIPSERMGRVRWLIRMLEYYEDRERFLDAKVSELSPQALLREREIDDSEISSQRHRFQALKSQLEG